jgi:hypothetical protein
MLVDTCLLIQQTTQYDYVKKRGGGIIDLCSLIYFPDRHHGSCSSMRSVSIMHIHFKLRIQKEMTPQRTCTFLGCCTAQQPRKAKVSKSSQWKPQITQIMKILRELLHKVLAGPVGGFYYCYFKFREECNKITEQLIKNQVVMYFH